MVMPQYSMVVTATARVKKYKDNEDADSAHAEQVQVRALYNEKSKEFHKILIIVLGSALFFFVLFLVPSMQQL
jgi:hypothetical protein